MSGSEKEGSVSDDSPLFVSALELLAHSTELYRQGSERKYKFVILHLANAVELILKDRLVDKGISIYVSGKPQTITIWDSFAKLEAEGINIPERPVFELLVDDRNTIQHRFGLSDAETVYYYLKRVIGFFGRFLSEEYAVDLSAALGLYLTSNDLIFLGLTEEEKDPYAQLDELFELSPEAAVVQAYNLLEGRFLEAMDLKNATDERPIVFWRAPEFPALINDLEVGGYVPQGLEEFRVLRDVRNRAAHTAHFEGEELSPDWGEALRIAKSFLNGIDQAVANGSLPSGSEQDLSN